MILNLIYQICFNSWKNCDNCNKGHRKEICDTKLLSFEFFLFIIYFNDIVYSVVAFLSEWYIIKQLLTIEALDMM